MLLYISGLWLVTSVKFLVLNLLVFCKPNNRLFVLSFDKLVCQFSVVDQTHDLRTRGEHANHYTTDGYLQIKVYRS